LIIAQNTMFCIVKIFSVYNTISIQRFKLLNKNRLIIITDNCCKCKKKNIIALCFFYIDLSNTIQYTIIIFDHSYSYRLQPYLQHISVIVFIVFYIVLSTFEYVISFSPSRKKIKIICYKTTIGNYYTKNHFQVDHNIINCPCLLTTAIL